MAHNAMLDAALEYLDQGLSVTPVKRSDKQPYVKWSHFSNIFAFRIDMTVFHPPMLRISPPPVKSLRCPIDMPCLTNALSQERNGSPSQKRSDEKTINRS